MDGITFGILFAIAFFAIIIFFSVRSSKKIEQHVESLNYTFDKRIAVENAFFCVDYSSRIVALVFSDRHEIVPFADIRSVNVVVDGHSTYSRSVGKVVGAALVGGIIGALCVGSKEKKHCSDIHINVGTRNYQTPTLRIDILSFEIDDADYFQQTADDIANILNTIIEEEERNSNH